MTVWRIRLQAVPYGDFFYPAAPLRPADWITPDASPCSEAIET